MRILTRQILPVFLAVAGLVLAWGLLVRFTGVPAYLIPSPSSVWAAGWGDRALLGSHLAATLKIALSGFALGALGGVAIGIALGLSATLRRAAEPLLIASQAIPPVVLAPILISAMGFGAFPKILVVALGAFFPIAISASAAMRDADRYLVDLLVSMGASPFTVLRRVRLPGAIPAIVAGAKVAASYVVFSAIIAEWMGSSIGLGVYLQRSQASYRMDQLFAAVGVIAVLGVLLFWLASLIGDTVLARFRSTPNRKGV
ncbi:NitT/TauT family transport system permease protein [Leucobacter komagatae]|uniref:NitT/TauT family transport system permease protein n=1 Tax=Leucobacter komagatae TaxID=55969 RepID=A0A542YA40_9MICO|nr:ABC transporter permease [Leucobacter komagatae]TQL44903.1 NitT/TauT family transport system permease protein [Leucobacter komagatae]